MSRSLKDGVYRPTKLQMPRQTESPTALPFYAADTIDDVDPALETPALPRLSQLQRDDEADYVMAHRWARHPGCSLQLIQSARSCYCDVC